MAKKSNWFVSNTPNLFIGGAGASYLPEPTDLADRTSLSQGNIRSWDVDPNDNISCFVENNWTKNSFEANIFSDDSVTYVIDLDGKWTSGSHCNDANSLTHFYAPNLTNMDQFTLNGCAVLEKVHTGVININDRYYISNNGVIKKLYLDTATSSSPPTTGSAWQLLSAIERLWIGNLTTLSTNDRNMSMYISIRGCMFRNSKANCKIYYHPDLGVTDRNAFTRITGGWNTGDTVTINALTYTAVSGTPVTDGEFQDDGSHPNTVHGRLKTAIVADTRPGSADFTMVSDNSLGALYSNVLGSSGNTMTAVVGSGNTGTATVEFSPFRYGIDVHASLVYAREQRTATLIEVDNVITVNAPTSLSYSGQTATSVDLTFTEPTANANGTEGYEVWIDDGTPYRYLFDYVEISGTTATLDLTGITQAGLKIKLRTMDGQLGFSSFSNEITL
tara:strand:+ start:5625 stop:6962 length:1338 start_codon:yes stop_codon:yes gene_type:complete